jgi:DNA-binding transcriptional regulator WhiA
MKLNLPQLHAILSRKNNKVSPNELTGLKEWFKHNDEMIKWQNNNQMQHSKKYFEELFNHMTRILEMIMHNDPNFQP